MSLQPHGTPASGPTGSLAMMRFSFCLAYARAGFGVGVQNAWSIGSSTSMRASTASVTSSANSLFARIDADSANASVEQILFPLAMSVLPNSPCVSSLARP